MPYRAMLFSILTVVLALGAVGVWIRTVGPVVAEVDAVAASEPKRPARPVAATGAADVDPSREGQTVADFSLRMHRVVPGTMMLSFILICLLLVVGFAATFREWARYSTQRRIASRERTEYVDAWKLAGERATLENPGDLREDPPESPHG